MRRSAAPSAVKSGGIPREPLFPKKTNDPLRVSTRSAANDDTTTIVRQPLFEFLSIPDQLKKQFTIPAGCVITKKSLELRRVKTLGGTRRFQPLVPGQYRAELPKAGDFADVPEEEEDQELNDLPTSALLAPFEPLVLWTDTNDESNKVEVIPQLASKLRPHQREGVQFLFECTMGLRGFEGQGCILADDMGLGKTLMSITVLWTLLNQGLVKGESAIRKAIVCCPTSLVGNWDNEIKKWVGDKCPTFPCKSDAKRVIKDFVAHRGKGVLIVSYETQRLYSKLFHASAASKLTSSSSSSNVCCELLICDEAHKLKNADCALSVSLKLLPAKKRILLSGTPMQNELTEFFNMVDFCNPNVLGTLSEFRKKYERPILRAKEMDATESDRSKADKLQKELSTIVNEFILKRGNILNAKFLPPKLVQYVCCDMGALQDKIYSAVLQSKELRHITDGKQTDTLGVIRRLINICSHPRLIVESYKSKLEAGEKPDSDLENLVKIIREHELESRKNGHNSEFKTKMENKFAAKAQSGATVRMSTSAGSSRTSPLLDDFSDYVDVSQSGKLFVLHRLMLTMRVLNKSERIVIVSNYTQTLDIIERMCSQNNWPFLRLDGTTAGTKRTQLVETFNNPSSGQFAFLLSSKAGGCGINLIGGNRLVLFDPDWNPASDKQAAGRIWREGQQKRCFIYRFMSTGSIEEKIIQRQLSKEGLQNIVDDKEQVNIFSTQELKQLFTRRTDTRSDTHDTLRCKRCNSVKTITLSSANVFNAAQIDVCSNFITSFADCIRGAAEDFGKIFPLDDFISLKQQLIEEKILTLPMFSKRIRELSVGIDVEQSELGADRLLPGGFSVNVEFVNRWVDVIPLLTAAKTKSTKDRSNAAEDDDNNHDGECEDEYVEQEGCPDDTDFNRWSHHCSVRNIDDDMLRRAMGDDTTVSFVFGLEVNWDLLSAKLEVEREAEMLRKEEETRNRIELNERRKAEKESKEKKIREKEIEKENATNVVASRAAVAVDKATTKMADEDFSNDGHDSDVDEVVLVTASNTNPCRNPIPSNVLKQVSQKLKKEVSALKSPINHSVTTTSEVKRISHVKESDDSDDDLLNEMSSNPSRTSTGISFKEIEKKEATIKKRSRQVLDSDSDSDGGIIIPNAKATATKIKAPIESDRPLRNNCKEITNSGDCGIDWNCPMCTYLNKAAQTSCDLCDTARVDARRRRTPAATARREWPKN